MKSGQCLRIGLLLVGMTLGMSLVGCGAMRGKGPSEDAAFSAATIDQSSAKSAALSVLELLRLASEKAMPQGSPRETAFLKAVEPLVDGTTLVAALKTTRTGKSVDRSPAPGLFPAVLRQWPLLMAFYRDGLKTDQAIEQITVPPLGVKTDTMVVFVPATHDDSSIWLGFKCVRLERGWKVYDLSLYPKPPAPPVSIDVTPVQ